MLQILQTNRFVPTLLAASLSCAFLTACGVDDKPTLTIEEEEKNPLVKGQLRDSNVEGATVYQEGKKIAVTDKDGLFEYKNGIPVTFKVGKLTLGTAKKAYTKENGVFIFLPDDLADNAEDITEIAQTLQSLDVDDNPDNGIKIDATKAEKLTEGDLTEKGTTLENTVKKDLPNEVIISEKEAKAHLDKTKKKLEKIAITAMPALGQAGLDKYEDGIFIENKFGIKSCDKATVNGQGKVVIPGLKDGEHCGLLVFTVTADMNQLLDSNKPVTADYKLVSKDGRDVSAILKSATPATGSISLDSKHIQQTLYFELKSDGKAEGDWDLALEFSNPSDNATLKKMSTLTTIVKDATGTGTGDNGNGGGEEPPVVNAELKLADKTEFKISLDNMTTASDGQGKGYLIAYDPFDKNLAGTINNNIHAIYPFANVGDKYAHVKYADAKWKDNVSFEIDGGNSNYEIIKTQAGANKSIYTLKQVKATKEGLTINVLVDGVKQSSFKVVVDEKGEVTDPSTTENKFVVTGISKAWDADSNNTIDFDQAITDDDFAKIKSVTIAGKTFDKAKFERVLMNKALRSNDAEVLKALKTATKTDVKVNVEGADDSGNGGNTGGGATNPYPIKEIKGNWNGSAYDIVLESKLPTTEFNKIKSITIDGKEYDIAKFSQAIQNQHIRTEDAEVIKVLKATSKDKVVINLKDDAGSTTQFSQPIDKIKANWNGSAYDIEFKNKVSTEEFNKIKSITIDGKEYDISKFSQAVGNYNIRTEDAEVMAALKATTKDKVVINMKGADDNDNGGGEEPPVVNSELKLADKTEFKISLDNMTTASDGQGKGYLIAYDPFDKNLAGTINNNIHAIFPFANVGDKYAHIKYKDAKWKDNVSFEIDGGNSNYEIIKTSVGANKSIYTLKQVKATKEGLTINVLVDGVKQSSFKVVVDEKGEVTDPSTTENKFVVTGISKAWDAKSNNTIDFDQAITDDDFAKIKSVTIAGKTFDKAKFERVLMNKALRSNDAEVLKALKTATKTDVKVNVEGADDSGNGGNTSSFSQPIDKIKANWDGSAYDIEFKNKVSTTEFNKIKSITIDGKEYDISKFSQAVGNYNIRTEDADVIKALKATTKDKVVINMKGDAGSADQFSQAIEKIKTNWNGSAYDIEFKDPVTTAEFNKIKSITIDGKEYDISKFSQALSNYSIRTEDAEVIKALKATTKDKVVINMKGSPTNTGGNSSSFSQPIDKMKANWDGSAYDIEFKNKVPTTEFNKIKSITIDGKEYDISKFSQALSNYSIRTEDAEVIKALKATTKDKVVINVKEDATSADQFSQPIDEVKANYNGTAYDIWFKNPVATEEFNKIKSITINGKEYDISKFSQVMSNYSFRTEDAEIMAALKATTKDNIVINMKGADANGNGGGTTPTPTPTPTPNPSKPTAAMKINDTGVTYSADVLKGNADGCSSATQDCNFGRDKDGSGFDFVKLDKDGNEVVATATAWDCVKDRTTGLVWERRTYAKDKASAGYRDSRWDYTYYDASQGLGKAEGSSDCKLGSCTTAAYTAKLNENKVCGIDSWRLPTRLELFDVINLGSSDKEVVMQAKWFSSIFDLPAPVEERFKTNGETDDMFVDQHYRRVKSSYWTSSVAAKFGTHDGYKNPATVKFNNVWTIMSDGTLNREDPSSSFSTATVIAVAESK